jgi:membrane protein
VGPLALLSRAAVDAFYRFNDDDGWAIASHIALSMLMSMFPFLIFVTALAGYAGSKELADEVARILFEAWPREVAAPIAGAVRNVLTTTRGDVLTVGVALAIYFSSSGIESVRIGLNRAYGMTDMRRWWWLRLESIGYVLVGAVALLILAFFVVLGPLIVATTVRYVPWLDPIKQLLTFARLGTATLVLVVALVVVHKWLPAGRRRMTEIAPGVVVTLLMWLAGGIGFGMYLAEFANSYVTMYAGLASAMIALVFLYWTASIFIYGGELNAAIARARGKRI